MTDAFEREYLGVHDIVHSEKVAFRGAAVVVGGLSVASAVFSVAGFVAAANGDLQALAGGAFFALLTVTLGLASVVGSVLRTIVTKDEVVLHAGVRHEVRIPLAGVSSVTLTKYDATARQRVNAEGKGAFAAIHPRKPIVCVEWVDAAGKAHVAYVASEAPDALGNIIRASSVVAKKRAMGTRVRVSEPPIEGEEVVEGALVGASRGAGAAERER